MYAFSAEYVLLYLGAIYLMIIGGASDIAARILRSIHAEAAELDSFIDQFWENVPV